MQAEFGERMYWLFLYGKYYMITNESKFHWWTILCSPLPPLHKGFSLNMVIISVLFLFFDLKKGTKQNPKPTTQLQISFEEMRL